MEEVQEYVSMSHKYKGKSYLSLTFGILSILILIILMIASVFVGGGESFEDGYQRAQDLGMIWSIFVLGSLVFSFIFSVVSIVLGAMAIKKENVDYKTFAVIGLVLGSIGLSLFLCCGTFVILGVIAVLSKGM